MVIAALLFFDQRLPLEELEERVRRKLLANRRFQQHVAEPRHGWGRPRWQQDAPFDIRRHLGNLAGPGPVPEPWVADLVSDRINAPLAPGSSPWSLELLDMGAQRSALLVRVHHSIADGLALVSVLQDVADERPPSPTHAVPLPARGKRGRPVRRILGEIGGLLHVLTLRSDAVTSLRGPLGGTKRVAWSRAIPLEPIRSIARGRGYRVTDILLGGASATLERHLRLQGESAGELRALLPIAGESLPHALGNHYASVFVDLPISGGDALARAETVAPRLARLRSRGEPAVARGLVALAGAAWPALQRRAVRWWSGCASLVVSSLAGPREALHIAGHRLQSAVVWAPTPASLGLSLTLFGYCGGLRLGVLADTAVIDRPQELVDGFEEAMAEIGAGVAREDS